MRSCCRRTGFPGRRTGRSGERGAHYVDARSTPAARAAATMRTAQPQRPGRRGVGQSSSRSSLARPGRPMSTQSSPAFRAATGTSRQSANRAQTRAARADRHGGRGSAAFPRTPIAWPPGRCERATSPRGNCLHLVGSPPRPLAQHAGQGPNQPESFTHGAYPPAGIRPCQQGADRGSVARGRRDRAGARRSRWCSCGRLPAPVPRRRAYRRPAAAARAPNNDPPRA